MEEEDGVRGGEGVVSGEGLEGGRGGEGTGESKEVEDDGGEGEGWVLGWVEGRSMDGFFCVVPGS